MVTTVIDIPYSYITHQCLIMVIEFVVPKAAFFLVQKIIVIVPYMLVQIFNL